MVATDKAPGPLVAERSGSLLRLELHRPAVHNALNDELLRALSTALQVAAADPTVRVVVLAGAGHKAFSAGADLDEFAGLSATEAWTVLRTGQELLRQLGGMPVPVIAEVGGLALGGGFELALACTFVIASRDARFAFPESGLGLMPGYGGTQRLSRLVGSGPALHLMLTGARMDAERAYQLGLVAVPPVATEALRATTDEIARQIASRGPHAVRLVLEAVAAGAEAPLDVGLRLEHTLAALAIASPEGKEGITAFREHRPPTFEDSR